MVVLIEKLTSKLTRLTTFSKEQWCIQEFRFRESIALDQIGLKNVEDMQEAIGLIVQKNTFFKEYRSSANVNDVIIEILN